MKAVVLTEYGDADALDCVERTEPAVGPGQVLVRQHATSFNPFDMKLASGALRDAIKLDFPFVPGGDVSGVVEAVGDDVVDLRVGDAVFGYSAAGGAYAELIAVAANVVSRKPENVDFVGCAAVVLVGQTASQAFEAAGVGAGDALVVIGGGGAVGLIIVQLANNAGVEVTAIADARDADRLRAIGAFAVLPRGYSTDDAPAGASAVIDTVGGEEQSVAFGMIREGGILVALNQPPSEDEAKRRGVRAVLMRTETTRRSLDALRDRIEAGTIRPFVGARYALCDAPKMWRDATAGRTSGKLVLIIADA